MFSKPSQTTKNVVSLLFLLCVLFSFSACSTSAQPVSQESELLDVSNAQAERTEQLESSSIAAAQHDEEILISSVLESSAAKTEYTLGEAFDETGLCLTLQYSSGKTDTITNGFSSDLDSTSPGEKEVHIQYQGNDVGLLRVTVTRPIIIESCDTGFGYDSDVHLVSYGRKLYGIGIEYPDATHCEFFIYRKDTLDAAPVRLFCSQYISDFFILNDRIFFSTATDDYRSFIASIDLNGGDYYELTDPEQNCKWCYYSNGWIYSYAQNAKQIVRFRTNGSEFSPVVADKSRYNPAYYIANGRIISQSTLDAEEMITCYDTATDTSSVIVQAEPDQTRLEGVYGDLLFYSVMDRSQNGNGGWIFILYDLKTGSSTPLASGPHDCTYHALVLNGSIVVYTWDDDVSFRNPAEPSIAVKGFTLPAAMSGSDTSGCRMICAGDLLAFSDGQGNIYLVDENNTVQTILRIDGSNASELASHVVSDTNWTQVYSQFLSAYAESLSYIDFKDCYALYDFTGDNIPELFLAQQLEPSSPFYDYFIYTIDGASVVPLGQIPGSTFSLCPVDGSGFLSVMQRMFCETVILYTYENGILHEQTLLYEVPVDQLPANASTPLDELGYHILTQFQSYSVDDLSGLSESGISSGSNQALISLLQSGTNNS